MASDIIRYSTGKGDIVTANHYAGVVNFMRSDAYVNLADVAEPFGKRVDNWMRLKSTKSLFDAFARDVTYGGAKPVIASKGGVSKQSSHLRDVQKDRGTWAHPDIAIQFAQWCDPGFALWVSRQIRHLMTYGEVNLHYTEWTPEEIESGHQYNREDADELYPRW